MLSEIKHSGVTRKRGVYILSLKSQIKTFKSLKTTLVNLDPEELPYKSQKNSAGSTTKNQGRSGNQKHKFSFLPA